MGDLQRALCKYNLTSINDFLHVIARKNGRVVFDDYYKVIANIDTNYSRVTIDWEIGTLPLEYRDPSQFEVDFKYYKNSDKLHIDGDYNSALFNIVIQLPPKDSE